MSFKGLILTLKAPFASFGTISAGDNRTTEFHPTASSILGLAASSIGIKNHDHDKKIAWYNGFSVATLSAEEYESDFENSPANKYHPSLCSDFHTVRDSLSMNDTARKDTAIGQREYLNDSLTFAALIANHSDAEKWLQDLVFAFRQPAHIPYLGRRSNPLSAPVLGQNSTANNFKSITHLAEEMFLMMNEQTVGALHPVSCRLRVPADLCGEEISTSTCWTHLQRVAIPDQRVGSLRFFTQRLADDFYRTTAGEQ